MQVAERIASIRLLDKIIENPEYAKKLGLEFEHISKESNIKELCKGEEREKGNNYD